MKINLFQIPSHQPYQGSWSSYGSSQCFVFCISRSSWALTNLRWLSKLDCYINCQTFSRIQVKRLLISYFIWTEISLVANYLYVQLQFKQSMRLKIHFRPNNSTTSNTPTIDPSFVNTADNISKVLPLIWGQSTNTQSISECLNTFYDIISISGKPWKFLPIIEIS